MTGLAGDQTAEDARMARRKTGTYFVTDLKGSRSSVNATDMILRVFLIREQISD